MLTENSFDNDQWGLGKLDSPLDMQFCGTELAKIRKRAFRRGFWFKVLSRTERILMSLTIKVVDKVKSILLAKILRPIIIKLVNAMESQVTRLMRVIGKHLAHKLSEIGKKLGCKTAENWALDQGIIQFLAVMYTNTPRLYKV